MTDDAPNTSNSPESAPDASPVPTPGGGSSTSIIRLLAIGVGLTVVAAGVVGISFWQVMNESSSREVSIVEAPEGDDGMASISVPTGQQASMEVEYSGPPPGEDGGDSGSTPPDAGSGRPEMDAEMDESEEE